MLTDDRSLFVEFCGEEHVVAPADLLRFGRVGDLVIDDNPHLHRNLAVFDHSADLWWLRNVGSAIVVEIVDRNSTSRISVAPGSSVALPFEEAVLRFQAGPTTYEVAVEGPPPGLAPRSLDVGDAPPTITATDAVFTPDQLRCIVALAEPRLLDPAAPLDSLPTNKGAASRLGWTATRFNRKLDNVCGKIDRMGVAGLHGDTGGLATKRRERLVDFALSTSLVTTEHLSLLDTALLDTALLDSALLDAPGNQPVSP